MSIWIKWTANYFTRIKRCYFPRQTRAGSRRRGFFGGIRSPGSFWNASSSFFVFQHSCFEENGSERNCVSGFCSQIVSFTVFMNTNHISEMSLLFRSRCGHSLQWFECVWSVSSFSLSKLFPLPSSSPCILLVECKKLIWCGSRILVKGSWGRRIENEVCLWGTKTTLHNTVLETAHKAA